MFHLLELYAYAFGTIIHILARKLMSQHLLVVLDDLAKAHLKVHLISHCLKMTMFQILKYIAITQSVHDKKTREDKKAKLIKHHTIKE